MILEEIVLYARDLEALAAFYRDVVGLEPIETAPIWRVFRMGTTRLAVCPRAAPYAEGLRREGEVRGHSGTEIVLRVDDLGAMVRALKRRGAIFDLERCELPYGTIATLTDPEGHSITFFERLER